MSMRREDLGIDPKTGKHDRRLTRAENAFLGCLWVDHVGEENKISGNALAGAFAAAMGCGPPSMDDLNDFVSGWKRSVRLMQNHLLCEHDHVPIFSQSGIGGGYWIAASETEGYRFNETFRRRALTGMRKAARGKKAVMVQMVQQLSFEFDEFKDLRGIPEPVLGSRPTPIAVVDAFFQRMLSEPEKYARDLARLGKKYGGVLLPKSWVEQIGTTARQLQELVTRLT